MAGLGKDIIDNLSKFYEGEALPQNTTKTSASLDLGTGGQNGGLAVRVRANTAISVADLKTISVKLQDSADDSTFADMALGNIFSATGAGSATTFSADELICEAILPSTARRYVKVAITTDDASASGSFDAYINYPAR